MKKINLFKFTNCRTGESGWSLSEVWNDFTNTYSDEYEVGVPDEFSLGKTVTGDSFLYKDGEDQPTMIGMDERTELPIHYTSGGSLLLRDVVMCN